MGTKVKLYVGLAFMAFPLIAVSPVQALTHSSQNGDIAYIQERQGRRTLWTLSAYGHAKHLLERDVTAAAWSPDGSHLAYLVGTSKCATQLKVMYYAAKSVETVARGGCIVGDVAWSPDSTQLALTRAKGTARAVMTVKPAEGFERAVTGWKQGVAYQNPTWSPDATWLAYEKHTIRRSDLVVHNLRTHATRTLIELSDLGVEAKPSWSPSGKKLLYQDSKNEIYTIWPDGTHRAVISDGDSYDAQWSPDGSRIVFLEDFSGEGFSISMPDGSVEHRDISSHGYISARWPVWSPDAQKIVLTIETGSGNRLVQFDLQTLQPRILASNVVGIIKQNIELDFELSADDMMILDGLSGRRLFPSPQDIV